MVWGRREVQREGHEQDHGAGMTTKTPGIIPDAKLLPCPFCGKKGVWFKTGRDVGIECENHSNCPGSAQTAVYEPEHAEHAVGCWNTRNDQAAISDIALEPVAPISQAIITALRFYASGEHYSLDDNDDFDSVSGEPENWLCSGREGSATMVEDGLIARRALRGEPIQWVDGDDDDTPKPIDGEADHAAPQQPAAPEIEQLRAMLLWSLYNHQGASSKVGQPIRKLLGIGQYDDLTMEQARIACEAAKATQP
jgi:hypothetical protein